MDLKKLLSWIPGWLGFLALILVGTLMVVHGAANPFGAALSGEARAGFIVFGACALIIGERQPSTDLKTSLNDVLRKFAVQV